MLLGCAVAETSQITGALLVFALLVMPAATAQQLTARPMAGLRAHGRARRSLVVWLGLSAAYFSVYPVGFYITTFAFAGYVLAAAGRTAVRDGPAAATVAAPA